MMLLIKSCNLNQTQLEPFMPAELYALATLIMDTATVLRGLGEKLSKSSTSPHYNVTGGIMQNKWLCLIFKISGKAPL